MKKTVLILLAFFGINTCISGQCVKTLNDGTGNIFGNNTNPSYEVEGPVELTLMENSKDISVELLDGFDTAWGPDVQIFLVKSEGRDVNAMKQANFSNLEKIFIGLLEFDRTSSGEPVVLKSYNSQFPEEQEINEYDVLYLRCVEFNQLWDFAFFESFNNSNCNVLSIEDKELADIGLAQNPVEDVINITNPGRQALEIRIFDTVGNLVVTKVGNTEQNQLDVSGLASGFYVVELSSGIFKKTQQLVIR